MDYIDHDERDSMGNHVFRYSIMRKDGKHYNGSAYGDERDWSGSPFTYSRKGAEAKIQNFLWYFGGCVVVREEGCTK